MLFDEGFIVGWYISYNAIHNFWSVYYLQIKAVSQVVASSIHKISGFVLTEIHMEWLKALIEDDSP
jgi:hypothetical protein